MVVNMTTGAGQVNWILLLLNDNNNQFTKENRVQSNHAWYRPEMSDHTLLSRHLKKTSDNILASIVATSCSHLLHGSSKSVFSCLYGSLQRYHNSQPSTFVCDHNWLVISNFFSFITKKNILFSYPWFTCKTGRGQLRKTLSGWQLNTLKCASGLPFCSIYIPYVFIGSSSWIDFTNPEIRKWWASKFALSEYQVIWKFLCFFNGTITSPTPSLVKNRHH